MAAVHLLRGFGNDLHRPSAARGTDRRHPSPAGGAVMLSEGAGVFTPQNIEHQPPLLVTFSHIHLKESLSTWGIIYAVAVKCPSASKVGGMRFLKC